MIELQHVSKTFENAGGRVDALRDVSLTIADGDIYGIIGMSGAGKSTLVRCINMLERPTEGRVIVNGQQLDAMTPAQLRAARREITMIFQRFNLLMQRTAVGNICFPMEIAGVKRDEAARRAREYLDIVGLPDNGIFKIGDTLTEGEHLHFRGLPSFSPELFKYIENDDPMKSKQFQKGVEQLMNEGVAQMFVNQFNNRRIIGTVGQLQFEVIQYRLEHEYNAKCRWEPVHLYKACWIESDDAQELDNFKKRKYQYMAKDIEGRDVFLADSSYVLSMAEQDFEHIKFHFTSEF